MTMCRLDELLTIVALVFCHTLLSLQQSGFHSYNIIATELLIVFINLLICKYNDEKIILFCYCMLIFHILTGLCPDIECNHSWQR